MFQKKDTQRESEENRINPEKGILMLMSVRILSYHILKDQILPLATKKKTILK